MSNAGRHAILRIARPVTELAARSALYQAGLGLEKLGEFTDHQGFSGVMLGYPGAAWHLEFTHCPAHPVSPAATAEDLLVLYLPDEAEWAARCRAMAQAGFRQAAAFNPYWDNAGRTFLDPDGYRTVLQRQQCPVA